MWGVSDFPFSDKTIANEHILEYSISWILQLEKHCLLNRITSQMKLFLSAWVVDGTQFVHGICKKPGPCTSIYVVFANEPVDGSRPVIHTRTKVLMLSGTPPFKEKGMTFFIFFKNTL